MLTGFANPASWGEFFVLELVRFRYMANEGTLHLDHIYEYMDVIRAIIHKAMEALMSSEELHLSIYMIEQPL